MADKRNAPAGNGGASGALVEAGSESTVAPGSGEKPLTDSERIALAGFESKIEAGVKTFMQVGTCLATIRDGRLYREDFATFEDYLDGRWGMGRSHAYRMIDAAATVAEIEAVSPLGDILTAESQVREIAGLPPEMAVEVLEAAVERSGGKPTAKAIREAREGIAPKPVKTKAPAKATKNTKTITVVSDPEPKPAAGKPGNRGRWWKCWGDECGVIVANKDVGRPLYECECGERFSREDNIPASNQCVMCDRFAVKVDEISCPACGGELHDYDPPEEGTAVYEVDRPTLAQALEKASAWALEAYLLGAEVEEVTASITASLREIEARRADAAVTR